MNSFKNTILPFKNILNNGHNRSVAIKKNILLSLVIKGFNILTNLFLVPLTLAFVTPTEYGIWMTLTSIIGWFSFFDIGLGNGLRNKFAEAVSLGKIQLAKIYVSTTYAILIILITALIIIYFLINPFVNWSDILNCKQIDDDRLSTLVTITFLFFCLQFILQIISTILTANHEPAKGSLISFIGNVLIFISIYIIHNSTSENLLKLTVILGLCPVVALLGSTFYFYRTTYKEYTPSIKWIRFKYAKNLMNVGIKFFVIQIAFIILYQTNNIVIIQKFGPIDVTPFNVAYKYFFILPMFFNIISSPLWSAYTDAWIKKDIKWIQATMKKLHVFFLTILIVTSVLIVFSGHIYSFWIGNTIEVPFTLSLSMGIYVLINIWNGIYSQFLNGIGKVKLQLIISIIGSIVNIPLAIFFCDKFGLHGTVLSTIVITLFGAIIYPIQFNKIIENKARGVWNK